MIVILLFALVQGCKKKEAQPVPVTPNPVAPPDSVYIRYKLNGMVGLSYLDLNSVYTSNAAVSSATNTFVYPMSHTLTPKDSLRVAVKDSLYVRWSITGKEGLVMGKPLVAQFFSNSVQIYPVVTLRDVSVRYNGDRAAALIFSYKLK